jgi:hypothetical protein
MRSPALQTDSSSIEIAAAPDGRGTLAPLSRRAFGHQPLQRWAMRLPTVSVAVPWTAPHSHAASYLEEAAAASDAIGVAGQDLTRSAPAFNATPIDGLSALPACGGPKIRRSEFDTSDKMKDPE